MKAAGCIMSVITMILSLFGYSFRKTDNTLPIAYADRKFEVCSNKNTAELEEIAARAVNRVPDMTYCPEKDPFPDDSRIQALYFDGEEYNGAPAKVFAYIGFPETASETAPVPGMVLVHGGAGHAYAEWVQYWVNNGYAAISFDGFGQHVKAGEAYTKDSSAWELNPASHPTIDELRSFAEPITSQWFYYYFTDVILANSLLRADPRVMPDKVGATGISWGSYVLSSVLGYDDRFAFAVPVYGGGFQNESFSMFKGIGEKAIGLWDASLRLPNVETPVLFLNSDSDIFFSANTATLSAAAAPKGEICLINGLNHSQDDGAYPPEILRYANSFTGLGEGNIKITSVCRDKNRVIADFTLPADAKSPKIKLYYRTQTAFEYKTETPFSLISGWERKKGAVINGIGCVKLPKKAKVYYIAIEAKCGKTVIHASTGLYENK